jgi:hypothetical protein
MLERDKAAARSSYDVSSGAAVDHAPDEPNNLLARPVHALELYSVRLMATQLRNDTLAERQ